MSEPKLPDPLERMQHAVDDLTLFIRANVEMAQRVDALLRSMHDLIAAVDNPVDGPTMPESRHVRRAAEALRNMGMDWGHDNAGTYNHDQDAL